MCCNFVHIGTVYALENVMSSFIECNMAFDVNYHL